MATNTDTLHQMFPHIGREAIDEVLHGLVAEAQGDPERLLYRASSELLKGNFNQALGQPKKGPAVVDVDAAAPPPGRDMASEKVEILAFIEGMAPDVDKTWLSGHYETFVLNAEQRPRTKDHIQGLLANYILEHNDYPKRAKAAVQAPIPATDYTKYDKMVTSAGYRTQCLEQIQQDFRWLTLPCLREVLQRFNYHYCPTYKFIKTDLNVSPTPAQREQGEAGDKPKSATDLKMLSKPRQAREVDPVDPAFFDEFLFTHKEELEKQAEADKAAREAKEDEEAERTGNVMECGCCFTDTPMTRMVQCTEGHLFCSDCLRHYVEEAAFSSGQTTVHCLDQSGCKANFPMAQLLRAIPAQKLDKIFARLADLDIKKAGLENVHGCPHCDFQMEIPNPDEKLFKCQNPECLKESCLLCKEPNHIPLRCEEVEKAGVTDYRKKVEEAMTASLVRTCPKCKAKFFKTEGCNKMTCSCGAHVCYVCREIIKGKDAYSHFCNHDRGPREFGACADCKKCFLFLKSTEDSDKQLVEAAKLDATKEFAAGDEALAAVQVGMAEPVKKTTAAKGKKGKKQPAQHQAYPVQRPQFGLGMPFAFGVPNLAGVMGQLQGQLQQALGRAMPAPMPKAAGLQVNHLGKIVNQNLYGAAAAPPQPPAPVINLLGPDDVLAPGRGLKRKNSRLNGLGGANQPIDLDDDAIARELQRQFDEEEMVLQRQEQMRQLQRDAYNRNSSDSDSENEGSEEDHYYGRRHYDDSSSDSEDDSDDSGEY